MEESRFELFAGLLNSAVKSIQRLKAAGMKQFNLSAAHTTCLCRLAEAGEDALTQGQLIQLEGMDRAHISRVVGELCKRGYAAPEAQSGQYRKHYHLTPQGREITNEIQKIILSVNRFVSDQIPREDIEVFYRTLRTITQNLERAAAECR